MCNDDDGGKIFVGLHYHDQANFIPSSINIRRHCYRVSILFVTNLLNQTNV